jgi:hypothetical protein
MVNDPLPAHLKRQKLPGEVCRGVAIGLAPEHGKSSTLLKLLSFLRWHGFCKVTGEALGMGMRGASGIKDGDEPRWKTRS